MAAKKILILTINPKDTGQLRLDEEVRQIKEALKLADRREQFEVVSEWALRTNDLHRHLLHHQPQIVHFSGHGTGEKGLAVEDKTGHAKLVSTATLERLFRLCRGVECVLLNACYSAAQTEAIAKHVDYVIGMSQAIGDQAAIKFAEGFYDGLGYGRSYAEAFEFGLLAIEEDGIPEETTPVLTVKSQGQQAEEIHDKGSRPETLKAARVFISYKRNVAPDESVALVLYEALKHTHSPFIDQSMLVGTRWAEQIETELRQADALVVLLSVHSVQSEMVQQEIALAHKIGEDSGGKPQILPVRLAYHEPFQYPLSIYLDPINWAVWESNADTQTLIAELTQAISGGTLPVSSLQQKRQILTVPPLESIPRPLPAAQPKALELPEGTMDLESSLYIQRPSDKVALQTIQQQGVTITIKGPRQMGKSSLLTYVMAAAQTAGKQVAFLDFQLFDRAALQNADEFYPQFCFWLADELDLDDCVAEHWRRPVSNNQRCNRYMGRYILQSLTQPLVLAMDEVERIFDTPFRNDFFSMLRSWHNQRATKKLWKQLDLALVTSTEPYQLIDDLNQSPFNVGQVIRLEDFNADQAHDLNKRHGLPLNAAEEQCLMQLVNGHPYLIRKALYLVASQQCSAQAIFNQATDEKGPFGDHLRYHLFRLYNKKDLVNGFLRILRDQTCPDEVIYFRLHGAGLVYREGQQVLPRCELYARFFREHL